MTVQRILDFQDAQGLTYAFLSQGARRSPNGFSRFNSRATSEAEAARGN